VRSGPFSDRLKTGGELLIDGAMGTELDRRGAHTYLPLWSALGLINAPDDVRSIHADYARAGADILVTNTFRSTGRMLVRADREAEESTTLDQLAVRLAREAAEQVGSDALVAGSIAPLEDCYSPWLSPDPAIALEEHRRQARNLADAGVDFIMIETMPLIAEAEVAAIAALETGLEVTVGFVLGDDGKLLSGEDLDRAVSRIMRQPVSAIFINCTPRPVITRVLPALRELTDLPIGGYANLGVVDDSVGWEIDRTVTGESYGAAAMEWIEAGASIVGGCCGTTPEHIAVLRRMINVGSKATQ